MAVYGQIGAFDPNSEEWTQYAESLDLFMEANGIRAEAKKRTVFLASIGPSPYKLLRSLLAPDKPAETEYGTLRGKLQQHYSPKPSEIMQRFKFNSRTRKAGESVAEYLSQLRALAEYCNYGESLDIMLRDRFVCGIENKSMQRKMLTESELSLTKAVDIALSIEAAEKDTQMLGEATVQVQKINKVKSFPKQPRPSPQQRLGPKHDCYRCGGKDHNAQQCKFKDATCHHCKRKGHIRRACRSRLQSSEVPGGKVKHLEEDTNLTTTTTGLVVQGNVENEYELFRIESSIQGRKPYQVQLALNGKIIPMEVDTGASRTVVSKKTYEAQFAKLEMKKANIVLKTYNGDPVKVLGYLQVDVECNGKTTTLPLLVVDGVGPSLLGRDWLEHIQLDWRQIFNLSEEDTMLRSILKKHQEVFKCELGKFSGYKAKIHIEENSQPHFCRTRPVPLAMKPLVAKELDRLVEQGILESVEFSDWAAPIVPVLKSDKQSVRICGDFRRTVNQVAK